MNTLKTLESICDYMKNDVEYSLSYPNPSALSCISFRIQAYAEQLKALEEEEIQDLQNNGPKISGELGDLVITLARPNYAGIMKAKHIPFGEYSVSVAKTNDEFTYKELKIEGEADADGFWYFIHARPGDYGQIAFGIWITKEEYTILKKQIKKMDLAK